jgi:hypothetical protein
MVVFNWSKLEKFDFEIKNKFKKIRGLYENKVVGFFYCLQIQLKLMKNLKSHIVLTLR